MRVIIFGTASCNGWAYSFEANDYQYAYVQLLCERYNTMSAWEHRNGDGTVYLHPTVEAALQHHNKDRDECHDPGNKVDTLDGLFDFYSEDGTGAHSTLSRVLLGLASDPCEEGWPDLFDPSFPECELNQS